MPKIINVELTGRIAKFIPPYSLAKLQSYFSFFPKGYRWMPAFRYGYWDGRIRMLKNHRAPRGIFDAQRAQIEEELGIKFKVVEKAWDKAQFFDSGKVVSDRQYQNDCVAAMIKASAKGGGLVLGATGIGKTFTAAIFFNRLNGCACFVVDELHLMRQTQKELAAGLKEKVGIVGAGEFAPERITVATVQTLHRHRKQSYFKKWTSQLDVIIIDEVHTAMNRSNFETVETIMPKAVFGLTATLELAQKPIRMRAWSLAGPTCYEYALAQGQREGYLAQGVVGAVQYDAAPEEVNRWKKYDIPFLDAYEEQVVSAGQRNEFVCALVEEARSRDKYTVVLVEQIKHLENLSKLLTDVPHRVVSGKKAVDRRMRDASKFEEGRIRVILASRVFKKGINIKRIDVIIDAAARKSKNDPVQKFGRGVRLHEDKTGLIYIDVADVGNRFEKAAKRRRSALKSKGIVVKKYHYGQNPKAILDDLEQQLVKVIAKVGK